MQSKDESKTKPKRRDKEPVNIYNKEDESRHVELYLTDN